MNKKITVELSTKEAEILKFLIRIGNTKKSQIEDYLDEEVSSEELITIEEKLK